MDIAPVRVIFYAAGCFCSSIVMSVSIESLVFFWGRTCERIRSLAIPPAWTDVWICPPIKEGHVQAVGRDARRRKQYKYHPRWREVRDETEFDRMADFGKVLPKIRARVRRDLARKGLLRKWSKPKTKLSPEQALVKSVKSARKK